MLTHGPLTVGIVGAGCIGRTLGRGLRVAGWRVGPVVTRGEATARHAVRAIGDGRPHAQLTRQLLAADVLLLCAPDAQLAGIAAHLAEMGGKE
ncbi:MAG: NAD(P)-binding domain-containing protein [Candidatus Acidiferrales bacterium]|jgi:prephenate dehydrogenase